MKLFLTVLTLLFCSLSQAQVKIINEDQVSRDSSVLFKEIKNHIWIEGSRQMKEIALSAEGALVSYVAPGKYLVYDVEADKVKLNVVKIENDKSEVISTREFRVEKVGKPGVSFQREEDRTLSNGQTVNYSHLELTVPNRRYSSSWEVVHFEISIFKKDGSVAMPATFVSGKYPGKEIMDKIRQIGKGGKILFEQVVIKYKDGPYEKYGSLTVDAE
jgi:hypothetical protein